MTVYTVGLVQAKCYKCFNNATMEIAVNVSSESMKAAFHEVAKAISKDMPLVMHGSGDSQPSEVYPDSVSILSELTANYIACLVEAAVDAHEILNDGPLPLPLPPLQRSKAIPTPAPPESRKDDKKELKKDDKKEQTRKRERVTDEYWDEPIKNPKIQNSAKPLQLIKGPKYEGVLVDEWVGAVGVDFFDTLRTRKVHVRAPFAIGTQSFIFPVCHDVGLYGKVLEVQAARRSIAPVLADPVIQDLVRTEGALQGTGKLRKRSKKTSTNEEDVDEPEDTESEGEDGAAWPGLDGLLPVYLGVSLGETS